MGTQLKDGPLTRHREKGSAKIEDKDGLCGQRGGTSVGDEKGAQGT